MNATMPFSERLVNAWRDCNSMLCVGLDTDVKRLPLPFWHVLEKMHVLGLPKNVIHMVKSGLVQRFNEMIVDACVPYCMGFKPQIAFYERDGTLPALEATIRYICEKHPHHLIILDAKRGDIGHTNEAYAETYFDRWGVHAMTLWLQPGPVALRPFLQREGHGCIFVTRTSNPDAVEIQDLQTVKHVPDGGPERGQVVTEPFWLTISKKIVDGWNGNNNVGLVIGATYPKELRMIREAVGDDIFFLNPGIGKQADEQGLENPVQAAVEAGQNRRGEGMIINSSRGIVYASSGEDFATVAGRMAAQLSEEINSFSRKPAVTA